MSNFENQLAISAMLRGETPEPKTPFSHAVRAYEEHRLPEGENKPTILYGEILPPEKPQQPYRAPTRAEVLDELFEVAGWKPGAKPLIKEKLIHPEQPWPGYAAQRQRILGVK